MVMVGTKSDKACKRIWSNTFLSPCIRIDQLHCAIYLHHQFSFTLRIFVLFFLSMIFGVAFALACAVGNRYKLYDDVDRNVGCLWPVRFSVVAVVASLAGLGAYSGFVSQCRSKNECNTVHSYAVIVPVSFRTNV